MINFTVGPVMMSETIKEIGRSEIPYFRTREFSNIMFQNQEYFKNSLNCSVEDKLITLTGSGTLAMESAIINTITKEDRLLIVNGGSFGKRFTEICEVYGYDYDEIKLGFGESLTSEILDKYDSSKYTSFVVNLDETSSGVLYDLSIIYEFCSQSSLFLIVDAISSYLADEIDFSKYNIDLLIVGSQKALALPPGLSFIMCSKRAQKKINSNQNPVYYMDLKNHLINMERGQTPFTPAVSIIIQLNRRLQEVNHLGVEHFVNHSFRLATHFRNKIESYGCKLVTSHSSNAVTAFYVPEGKSAKEIFEILKNEYGIWITPSGGTNADTVLRVGHIGFINEKHMEDLYKALDELKERGIL